MSYGSITLLTQTADDFREMARRCYKESSDSFDRCDTDGFLSQWASDSMARLYNFAADLVDNDGKAEFTELFDLEGNLLPDAKYVDGKWGAVWRIWDEETRTVKWFNPSRAKKGATRQRNDAKKGYQQGRVRRPAVAALTGGYAAYPVAIPDNRTEEYEVVSTAWYEDWNW